MTYHGVTSIYVVDVSHIKVFEPMGTTSLLIITTEPNKPSTHCDAFRMNNLDKKYCNTMVVYDFAFQQDAQQGHMVLAAC